MTQKVADLHLHTTFSDGTFTTEEVIQCAKKFNLSCIAIADHDRVDGIKTAIKLSVVYKIEFIPAVEITAQEQEKELHILGYFIDWQEERLKEALEKIRQNRKERVYKMADKLKEHGVNADADEILKYAGDSAVSRLHVAKYLVNKNLLPSLQIVFDKYIGDGKPCCITHFRFSSEEVINIIKDVGGIAVIAHPGLNNVNQLLPILIKKGIDGIEVYHSDHPESVSKNLEKFAREHELLITGGSDCHGLNKKQILIGKIRLPYEYVERLKEAHVKRRRTMR